ncbi:glycosyltransferase family 4 protein [Kallotenue papyrolyticum]|uniref:glycosyltransferase family 4 protein n=1 Tax=Kallotenue papyrolyticum TaxID=1325125 RepID=UPI00047857FE|nr:glycosyltransferase family 1 protein [Kallotenue papyrolyticum]
MRIGIDARYLSHGLMGGVHTYLKHILPAIIAAAPEHALVLYADTKRPFELPDLPANVRVRLLPWRSGLSSIRHDLLLRRQMRQDGIQVAHFPANYGFAPRGTRTVITLHDAINILPLREIIRGHPKRPRTIVMMTYLHLCTTLAVRRADLLLTVSNWAADQIARASGFDRRRIVVIPHAPTPDLQPISDRGMLAEVRQRHDLPPRFVLADALKNPAVLIRAWRALPPDLRQSHRIVFFARRPDPLPIVGEAVAQGDARLIVRPTRADLIAFFSLADLFVFPSWIEGFGIPVLEAMSCGTPLIASNRGAIPEVAGDAAILIDAEDDAALTRELTRLLRSAEARQHLRERGFARAARFSWRTSAQLTLEAYERALTVGHDSRATITTAVRP